jgi:hypothetical protein
VAGAGPARAGSDLMPAESQAQPSKLVRLGICGLVAKWAPIRPCDRENSWTAFWSMRFAPT